MRLPSSPLRRHLRSVVREQERRLRNGLAMRRDRAWADAGEALSARSLEDYAYFRGDDRWEAPEWAASPRRRFHHGLRKTIAKLRRARAFLAEFDALRSA